MKIKIFILSIITIAYTAGLAHTGPYKDAKQHYQQQGMPEFLHQQIQSVQPKSSQEAELATLPASENLLPSEGLMQQYKEQKQVSLENLVIDVEPMLKGSQAQQIQSTAKTAQIDNLLQTNINLPNLMNITFVRNPKIKAASEVWQQALTRYPQSSFLEGILQQYNIFTQRQDLLLGGMRPGKERIDTAFPFPGVTALRGDIIKADITLAQLDYVITVRDLMTQAKKSFFNYIYILDAIDITQVNQALLEQMLEVASTQFEAGNIAYNDVIKARVELSKLTDNLITLEDQRETIIANLNTFMNRSPGEMIGSPVIPERQIPSETLERLYEIAGEHKQEIEQAQIRIHRTELMIDMAQEMNRPDPTLGASYFQNRSRLMAGSVDEGEAFNPAPGQMLRPWFGQRESFIIEMIHQKEKFIQQLEDVKNQTLLNVKIAHFSMNTAQRETNLYESTLLPEAEQSLEVAESDYLGARISFLDYLDAQRTWLDFNLAFYQAKKNLRSSIAELEQAVGKSLVPQL